MSVIDSRADQVNAINVQMRQAPTFGAFLQLEGEKQKLQAALRAAREELRRLASGWVFVPPRVR